MAAASPAIVAFTRHAEQRALERRLDLSDIGELLLSRHHQWRRNHGQAVTRSWSPPRRTAVALALGVRSSARIVAV